MVIDRCFVFNNLRYNLAAALVPPCHLSNDTDHGTGAVPFKADDMGRISVTKSLREKVAAKSNGKCFYCGDTLRIDTYYDLDFVGSVTVCNAWDVDHFYPVSRGGSNKIDNLVPACMYCNQLKHNKTIEEFRAVFGKPFYFEQEGLQP